MDIRVHLRPAGPQHVEPLERLLSHADQPSAGIPRPQSAAEARSWLAAVSAQWAGGQAYTFGVHLDCAQLAGMTRLGCIRPAKADAQLSYWMDPRYRGRGYATAAAALTLDFAFTHLELAAVRAFVASGNYASHAVIRKLGFRGPGRCGPHSPTEMQIYAYEIGAAEWKSERSYSMLVIRDEQMKVLQEAAARSRISNWAAEVQMRFPREVAALSSAEVHQRVDCLLARAWHYGLRQQRELSAFIQLGFGVGPHFDLHPPFQAILNGPAGGNRSKIEALFTAAGTEDWEAAARVAR